MRLRNSKTKLAPRPHPTPQMSGTALALGRLRVSYVLVRSTLFTFLHRDLSLLFSNKNKKI
jgi:hypothetical protein